MSHRPGEEIYDECVGDKFKMRAWILSWSVYCGILGIVGGRQLPTASIEEAWLRLDILGNITDGPGSLTRSFLSPAHIKAAKQIQEWMSEAGMRAWTDAVGNVHGRVDGRWDDGALTMIGSHYDTVADAGKYDGALGIVTAISAVKEILANHDFEADPRGPFKTPVEVVAFSDEEGTRFQTTFLGSRALAGSLVQDDLKKVTDAGGISLASALSDNGFTDDIAHEIAVPHGRIQAYIEIHTEQGPKLKHIGSPLGVVTSIAGQTFLQVTIHAEQSHAGTVPMQMRKDALASAAEIITLIERLCCRMDTDLKQKKDAFKYECKNERFKGPRAPITPVVNRSLESMVFQFPDHDTMLVCTVGKLNVWPGNSNVIAGEASFSVDIRSDSNVVRQAAIKVVRLSIDETCNRRSLKCITVNRHEADAQKCSPGILQKLGIAAQIAAKETRRMVDVLSGTGADLSWVCANSKYEDCTLWDHLGEIPKLISGAGHDGLALAKIAPIGMVFVRDNGVSHSPKERVDFFDVGAALVTIVKYLEMEVVDTDLYQTLESQD